MSLLTPYYRWRYRRMQAQVASMRVWNRWRITSEREIEMHESDATMVNLTVASPTTRLRDYHSDWELVFAGADVRFVRQHHAYDFPQDHVLTFTQPYPKWRHDADLNMFVKTQPIMLAYAPRQMHEIKGVVRPARVVAALVHETAGDGRCQYVWLATRYGSDTMLHLDERLQRLNRLMPRLWGARVRAPDAFPITFQVVDKDVDLARFRAYRMALNFCRIQNRVMM